MLGQKMLVPRSFCLKNLCCFVFVLVVDLVVKVLDQKSVGLKLFGSKNCVRKKLKVKKFVQNWVSNLIWLNVTRTYFSWTNVTVTVGIC